MNYQDRQAQQLQTENARLANKVKGFEAKPVMGKFESARGPGGVLQSQYQMKDPFAAGAKASPWMNMMLEQQQMQEQQALNRGQQQAATAAASARANLARRGGLSGGAAERLAGQAEEQRALGAQDIFGQGAQQRLGMQTEDFAKEREYQTGLQQTNIQNALQDLAQKREFELKKYEEQMKGYGAEKSAQATEAACFTPETEIRMADKTLKNIKDIQPGDEIDLGGKVIATITAKMAPDDFIYEYKGTHVTGSHYVFDGMDNSWVPVSKSLLGVKTILKPNLVYNLITQNRKIVTSGAIFWDYNDDVLKQKATNARFTRHA